ncbi:MAG: hypothetical protein ACRDHZ_10270 [Ktedonobacteraceae bacterium]
MMIPVRATWEETAEQFRKMTDTLGKRIDDGIFEMVVALNVLGITTRQSCQGHLEWGLPYPWVDINPEVESKYRLHHYLIRFYAHHPINFDSALAWQGYRLRSTGAAFADLLSGEQREQKLHLYQAEMAAFAIFLKQQRK